jgi:hypothetical protein
VAPAAITAAPETFNGTPAIAPTPVMSRATPPPSIAAPPTIAAKPEEFEHLVRVVDHRVAH